MPQLAFVIRLYDQVLRGDMKQLSELRRWMDGFGLTPKGRQDRRWQPPEPARPPDKLDRFLSENRYRDLRVTDD